MKFYFNGNALEAKDVRYSADLDKLLGLEEKGLKSAVILTLGNRATEGDWLQGMKKVRHPKEIFLTEIK